MSMMKTFFSTAIPVVLATQVVSGQQAKTDAPQAPLKANYYKCESNGRIAVSRINTDGTITVRHYVGISGAPVRIQEDIKTKDFIVLTNNNPATISFQMVSIARPDESLVSQKKRAEMFADLYCAGISR